MKSIEEIFVFVAENRGEDEGICAVQSPQGWIPLVFSKREELSAYRQLGQDMANVNGLPVRVKVFKLVDVIETFLPEKGANHATEKQNDRGDSEQPA